MPRCNQQKEVTFTSFIIKNIIKPLINPMLLVRAINTYAFLYIFYIIIPSIFRINEILRNLYVENCSSIFSYGSAMCNKLSHYIFYAHINQFSDFISIHINFFIISLLFLSPVIHFTWTRSFFSIIWELMYYN